MKKIILFAFLFQLLSCNKAAVDKALKDYGATEITEDGVLLSEHRIFTVSVETQKGNLGGITGADTICDSTAKTAGLKKPYKALLGIFGASVLSRLTEKGSVYTFSGANTKHKVSDSLTELISGNVDSQLYNESYGSSLEKQLWVGFDTDGNPTSTCRDWTLDALDFSSLGQSSYTAYLCHDENGNQDWMSYTESDCLTNNPSGEWKLVITNNTQDNGCHQIDKHIICISQ